jgi:hypothetical protein
MAPTNPLRGISADPAYLAAVLATLRRLLRGSVNSTEPMLPGHVL